jgi:hypothetical protein
MREIPIFPEDGGFALKMCGFALKMCGFALKMCGCSLAKMALIQVPLKRQCKGMGNPYNARAL